MPADVPGGVYWFDPAAFTSPADGTTCAVAGSPFGQITGTRTPREIQLGLRLTWN